MEPIRGHYCQESMRHILYCLELLDYNSGSSFLGKVTHIVNPYNFYILPMYYYRNTVLLNRCGRRLTRDELQENATVVFRSQVLHKYKRGMIKNIDENGKCQIFAIDHGITEENVTLNNIFYPLYEESLTTPPLIKHCELYPYIALQGDRYNLAISAFKTALIKGIVRVHVKRNMGNKLTVELVNIARGSVMEFINDHLGLHTLTDQVTESIYQRLSIRNNYQGLYD